MKTISKPPKSFFPSCILKSGELSLSRKRLPRAPAAATRTWSNGLQGNSFWDPPAVRLPGELETCSIHICMKILYLHLLISPTLEPKGHSLHRPTIYQTNLVPKTDTRSPCQRPLSAGISAVSRTAPSALVRNGRQTRPSSSTIPCFIRHLQAIGYLAIGVRLWKASQSWAAMLRISHSVTDAGRQWTLCGQLAGAWVQELRSCWEQGRGAAGSKAVIDLNDVTFIDEDGERLLAEMRSAGVEFIATGVATKHLLENLKGRGERPLRRLTGGLTSAKKIDSPCRIGGSSFDLTVEK
jgi:anti-anti-sigma regulatory factor